MKHTGRTFFCLLIALALVLGSLAWGARKGWQAEAQNHTNLYEQESGLKSSLALRAADASNLLKVAERHLSKQDSQFQAVASARDVLKDERIALPERCRANQTLSLAVDALTQALQAKSSFQESVRDQNYLMSLSQSLLSYNQSGAAQAYNNAAEDYNQRKRNSLSGIVAGYLGIEDAPLFTTP